MLRRLRAVVPCGGDADVDGDELDDAASLGPRDVQRRVLTVSDGGLQLVTKSWRLYDAAGVGILDVLNRALDLFTLNFRALVCLFVLPSPVEDAKGPWGVRLVDGLLAFKIQQHKRLAPVVALPASPSTVTRGAVFFERTQVPQGVLCARIYRPCTRLPRRLCHVGFVCLCSRPSSLAHHRRTPPPAARTHTGGGSSRPSPTSFADEHRALFPGKTLCVSLAASPYLNDPFFCLQQLLHVLTDWDEVPSAPRVVEGATATRSLCALRDYLGHHAAIALADSERRPSAQTVSAAVGDVQCLMNELRTIVFDVDRFCRQFSKCGEKDPDVERAIDRVDATTALWDEFAATFGAAGASTTSARAAVMNATTPFVQYVAAIRRKQLLTADVRGIGGRVGVDPTSRTIATMLLQVLDRLRVARSPRCCYSSGRRVLRVGQNTCRENRGRVWRCAQASPQRVLKRAQPSSHTKPRDSVRVRARAERRIGRHHWRAWCEPVGTHTTEPVVIHPTSWSMSRVTRRPGAGPCGRVADFIRYRRIRTVRV